ncbi:MAG: hypothetical protein V4655_03440 [Bdellovibrionota bacterium]
MRAYALLVFLFISQAFAAEKPIDYSTLDFTLTLTALRAGNHDESGTNSYFFQTKLYGLPIRKEDIKKPFADRPKSESDLGKFAELKIESLKYWTPEKKPTGVQLAVTGDKIRSLVAEVMRTHTVPEEQTAVKAVVTMYEMSKKFGWLGDDTKVGETSFDIITESLPRVAKVENKTLTIHDDQGTYVELKLDFKHIVEKAEAKE